MQQVFYPGHARQPCLGEYTIVLDHSEALARADIVLVSRAAHRGPSFWNSELGRNTVLNRIVATDLAGIRLEWIRLFVLHEKTAGAAGRLPEFLGVELKINLDIDDYVAKGNRCTVRRTNMLLGLITGFSSETSFWSGDVVGGCANVTASFKGARNLDQQEISELCGRIGIQPKDPAPPPGRSRVTEEPAAPRITHSSSSYH